MLNENQMPKSPNSLFIIVMWACFILQSPADIIKLAGLQRQHCIDRKLASLHLKQKMQLLVFNGFDWVEFNVL